MKVFYHQDCDVSSYLHLVPEIEKSIVDGKLDSMVIGLGPTAWLLRWVNRKLLADLRLWGCNEGCRIMPMDDLVVLDAPVDRLHPLNFGGQYVLESRPKRLWLSKECWTGPKRWGTHAAKWKPYLHPSMLEVTHEVTWAVWNAYGGWNPGWKFKLGGERLHTMAISPTGMVNLAWREGCRRIGVIGVDLQKGQHRMWEIRMALEDFYVKLANQAYEQGGLVKNLSPITSLDRFKEWTPPTPLSASSSAPTSGSETQEPNLCLSTASSATPPAQLKSTG